MRTVLTHVHLCLQLKIPAAICIDSVLSSHLPFVRPLGLGWEGHEAVEGVHREGNKIKRDIMGDREAKTMSAMKGEMN